MLLYSFTVIRFFLHTRPHTCTNIHTLTHTLTHPLTQDSSTLGSTSRPLFTHPLEDMSPFFQKQFTKVNTDVFSSYGRLLAEILLVLPCQLKKASETSKAMTPPEFGQEWMSTLCDVGYLFISLLLNLLRHVTLDIYPPPIVLVEGFPGNWCGEKACAQGQQIYLLIYM